MRLFIAAIEWNMHRNGASADRDFVSLGQHRKIAKQRAPRTADMRQAESIQLLLAVSVPGVGIRVGTPLHQPKRQRCTWKGVPASRRTNQRIDRVIRSCRGLCKSERIKQKWQKCQSTKRRTHAHQQGPLIRECSQPRILLFRTATFPHGFSLAANGKSGPRLNARPAFHSLILTAVNKPSSVPCRPGSAAAAHTTTPKPALDRTSRSSSTSPSALCDSSDSRPSLEPADR